MASAGTRGRPQQAIFILGIIPDDPYRAIVVSTSACNNSMPVVCRSDHGYSRDSFRIPSLRQAMEGEKLCRVALAQLLATLSNPQITRHNPGLGIIHDDGPLIICAALVLRRLTRRWCRKRTSASLIGQGLNRSVHAEEAPSGRPQSSALLRRSFREDAAKRRERCGFRRMRSSDGKASHPRDSCRKSNAPSRCDWQGLSAVSAATARTVGTRFIN
jgi:hypothetical protein